MANMQEITRFILDNSGIKDTNGDFDPSSLKDLDIQIKEITKALESATNSVVHVTKQIDDTGRALVSFDVPKNTTNNANAVWTRTVAGIETRYGYGSESLLPMVGGTPLPVTQDMRMLEFNKNFYGTKAKQELKSLVSALGGEAVTNPSKTYKDRMRIRVPISEKDYQSAFIRAGGDDTKAREALAKSYTSRNLKSAVKYSDDVRDNIKEAKQAEEQKKAEKDSKTSRLKMLGIIGLVVKGLQVIADITRRILTATLANASEVKKESLNAKSLGITYSNMREYKAQARAMGMNEDIFSNAIASLQSALGDPSNLNTKAIGELAKVMSSDVIKGIQIALGNNDPESAMASILNAYYERGQNGINSVGMNVGRYQAERELATALEKAGFNDLADILRNMFYTNDTGIYKGRISTRDSFADYMNLVTAYTMGISKVDNRHFAELGQVIDNVTAKFKSLTENLEKLVLSSLNGLINKIDNWDIGKSAEEKAKDTATNLQLNQQAKSKMTALSQASSNRANTLFTEAGIDFSAFGEGATAETVITELNKNSWSNINLTEDQKNVYTSMLQFARTDKGRQAMYSLITANLAIKKARQADEAITKGRKKGKIDYNKTDYTDSAIQSEVQDIIESFYSDAERKNTSNANLNYNMFDTGRYNIPVLGLLNKATNSGYSYSNNALYSQLSNVYYGGKKITYDEAIASGSSSKLTQALHEMLPENLKGRKNFFGFISEQNQKDAVKKALKSGALSQENVYNLMSSHVEEGWGFYPSQLHEAKKLFNARDSVSANEQAGANIILSSILALQQTQSYLAKHNAEGVVATVSGYDEKKGKVQVTLSVKGGDEKSPKEILSFDTDSILGKKENYVFDLSGIARDSVRKATAQ